MGELLLKMKPRHHPAAGPGEFLPQPFVARLGLTFGWSSWLRFRGVRTKWGAKAFEWLAGNALTPSLPCLTAPSSASSPHSLWPSSWNPCLSQASFFAFPHAFALFGLPSLYAWAELGTEAFSLPSWWPCIMLSWSPWCLPDLQARSAPSTVTSHGTLHCSPAALRVGILHLSLRSDGLSHQALSSVRIGSVSVFPYCKSPAMAHCPASSSVQNIFWRSELSTWWLLQ